MRLSLRKAAHAVLGEPRTGNPGRNHYPSMPQPFRAGLMLGTEQHIGRIGEPTLRDLSEALIAAYGKDYGVHSPVWISRFTDAARQAAAYRVPADPAGDAARVHYPAGGQGLNIGVQD